MQDSLNYPRHKKDVYNELRELGYSDDICSRANEMSHADKRKSKSKEDKHKAMVEYVYHSHVETGLACDPVAICRVLGLNKVCIKPRPGVVNIVTVQAMLGVYLSMPVLSYLHQHREELLELAGILDTEKVVPCSPQNTAVGVIRYILESADIEYNRESLLSATGRNATAVTAALNYIKNYCS